MSFRGRGRGPPGGRGGGRSFGGRGGGGRGGFQDYGPPDTVVEAGVFEHPCEGEMVCKLTNEKVRFCRCCWCECDGLCTMRMRTRTHLA